MLFLRFGPRTASWQEQIKDFLEVCLAASSLCVQWDGFQPDENGFIPLSLAQYSL